MILGILEFNNAANSCPVSYQTINQYGGTTATTGEFAATLAHFMAHALNTFYCRGALDTRVNPDTIGWVWIGKFDLKEQVGDSKISRYVWTGPNTVFEFYKALFC